MVVVIGHVFQTTQPYSNVDVTGEVTDSPAQHKQAIARMVA
jgi:hypothetical protein